MAEQCAYRYSSGVNTKSSMGGAFDAVKHQCLDAMFPSLHRRDPSAFLLYRLPEPISVFVASQSVKQSRLSTKTFCALHTGRRLQGARTRLSNASRRSN
jgi:hypothetical protein